MKMQIINETNATRKENNPVLMVFSEFRISREKSKRGIESGMAMVITKSWVDAI